MAVQYKRLIDALRGGLIVSVQEDAVSPLADPMIIAALAQSVAIPGVVGLRINGPENIRAVRQVVDVPIIGIYKVYREDGRVWITPGFEMAQACIQAGASLIALDPNPVDRSPHGLVEELIHRVHAELNVPVMADISTLEDGLSACQAGADLVATTMSGYAAPPFANIYDPPDLELVRQLAQSLPVPIVAEGRYNTPELARQALEAGAHAVVVGSAITRPEVITQMFVRAIHSNMR